MKREHSAVALFSGGLDSILAVVWMRELGYEVHPVFFSAPYIFPERAVRSAAENGLKLTVVDISQKHLEMLSDPIYGYGKNVNPCIDCHALMFREAGDLLGQFKADFLISGEVVGQRPMSQRRNALQAVDKHSGCGDLIIRPLSQKLLSDTKPIRDGWVEKDLLLAIHGRGRKRQIELAEKFGIAYPPPGGGCLLTDKNFSLRLRELIKKDQAEEENIRLLRWGRHFRLEDGSKLIVGRTESDNLGLEAENYPGLYFKIRDHEGPLGLMTDSSASLETLRQAASIVLAYASKAASPDWVKYGVDRNYNREIHVEKCPETVLRRLLITLDKEI